MFGAFCVMRRLSALVCRCVCGDELSPVGQLGVCGGRVCLDMYMCVCVLYVYLCMCVGVGVCGCVCVI